MRNLFLLLQPNNPQIREKDKEMKILKRKKKAILFLILAKIDMKLFFLLLKPE